MDELKPCPFCGKTNPLEISTSADITECEKCLEDTSNFVTVICNVNKGGCGATCGYHPKVKQAIKEWNQRT